jgi:hypothetical protein
MEQRRKPRERGFIQYVKDFFGGIFGRRSRDDHEGEYDDGQRPWDVGAREYGGRFIDNLAGRDTPRRNEPDQERERGA